VGPEAKDAPLISIQSAMLVALGFLMASLLALLLASAFWSRAVRLTTKRLTSTLPVSDSEIKADLDRLRAAYAIKVHKLETQLEQVKLERARHLIEINRRDASISALETDVVTIKTELDENLNARRVLEQTVADRLPKVEARLAEAKQLLANRDREIAELAQGARRHKAALEEASSINAQRAAEIERLNSTLATKGGRRRRAAGELEPEGEVALRAEAEVLRAKTREQAALIDRLQRQLGERHAVTGPGGAVPAYAAALEASGQAAADRQVDRLRESLSEAERTLQLARTGAPAEASRDDREVELHALKAQTEDQAGEIARLKAALAAFEQPERTGVRDSRLALKARAGSAEAQAERQAATISKLRAELAAANERLAQQATHYMEEMRRIGAGTAAVPTQTRRTGRDGTRRRLAERAAQVPPGPRPPPESPSALELAGAAQAGMADRATAGNGRRPDDGRDPATSPVSTVAQPAAAEMPQTAAIPGDRRRVSLLDRITGMGKG
jgi:chromosome segregation ATPase